MRSSRLRVLLLLGLLFAAPSWAWTGARGEPRFLSGQALHEFWESRGGNPIRVRIFRTAFKYPLLRVEELLPARPAAKSASPSRTVSVADHVLVKLRSELSRDRAGRLAAACSRWSCSVRPLGIPSATGSWAIIRFETAVADSQPEILRVLRGLGEIVELAEPDYVVWN
jgi:hypothetical protein